jgi:hypothetical protein
MPSLRERLQQAIDTAVVPKFEDVEQAIALLAAADAWAQAERAMRAAPSRRGAAKSQAWYHTVATADALLALLPPPETTKD